jgi:8-oxo-dGTP diphosphatase
MIESSCVYLIRDGRWLMMLRNKKKDDLNEGRWIGIGGKKLPQESIRTCARREVREETGLEVGELTYRGRVYFQSPGPYEEVITVYTGIPAGTASESCREGTLAWIAEGEVMNLNLWPGDRLFLRRLLEGETEVFCLGMVYDAEGNLLSVEEREAESE